jgi:hypothetical protein
MSASKGENAGNFRKTRRETDTELMRWRLLNHIENWYIGYQRPVSQDFEFITEDGKFELWECTLTPAPESTEVKKQIWLFWNAKEMKSYKSYQPAFSDFVTEQKVRKIQGRLRYITSPLVVSAILALAMMGIIGTMLVLKMPVPDQLWSLFTAVVAFYFGREGRVRATTSVGTD